MKTPINGLLFLRIDPIGSAGPGTAEGHFKSATTGIRATDYWGKSFPPAFSLSDQMHHFLEGRLFSFQKG